MRPDGKRGPTAKETADRRAAKVLIHECTSCSRPAKKLDDGTWHRMCQTHIDNEAKRGKVRRNERKLFGSIARRDEFKPLEPIVAAKLTGPTKADEARAWFMACRRRIAISA